MKEVRQTDNHVKNIFNFISHYGGMMGISKLFIFIGYTGWVLSGLGYINKGQFYQGAWTFGVCSFFALIAFCFIGAIEAEREKLSKKQTRNRKR